MEAIAVLGEKSPLATGLKINAVRLSGVRLRGLHSFIREVI